MRNSPRSSLVASRWRADSGVRTTSFAEGILPPLMSWMVPRSVPREFCAGNSNGDSTSNKSRKDKDVKFHEAKALLDRRGHLMGSDRLLERERLLPQVVGRSGKRKRARCIVPLHRRGGMGELALVRNAGWSCLGSRGN